MGDQSNLKPIEFEGEAAQIQDEALVDTFQKWEREKLIAYAVNLTQAFGAEQQVVKKLNDQFASAQNWALGLALVEEIGRNLASTLDLNQVLTQLMTRTYDSIDVEDGSILLIEEPSGDLVAQVVLGTLSNDDSRESFRVPQGMGIAGEVARTGVPTIVNNIETDSRHFKQLDEDTGFITDSLLCVPILTHEKILGVLEVVNKRHGGFTQNDQILLSSIANYAGIAIENAKLHQEVVEERNHVIRAQEEVSHKLQRDLHDGPTQLVAAIQMSIDFCQQAINHNAVDIVSAELDSLLELAKRASHQMRTLLFELRPLVLETKGLIAALETYLKRRGEEGEGIELNLVCTSDQPDNAISRQNTDVESAMFAIAQESVNNALKHAQAKNIWVKFDQFKNRLTMTIADDGVGFDVKSVIQGYEERGSYGMVNLRERVAIAKGDYVINSAPGTGTEITVNVPLETITFNN